MNKATTTTTSSPQLLTGIAFGRLDFMTLRRNYRFLLNVWFFDHRTRNTCLKRIEHIQQTAATAAEA